MEDFDALWASVQPLHDDWWGEPVCFVPQANGEEAEYFATGDDDLRPARELIGIVTFAPVVDRFLGRGANSRDNTDIMAERTTIDFDDSMFPARTEPVVGDLLYLLKRQRLPVYKIVSAEHNNAARWTCAVIFDSNGQP